MPAGFFTGLPHTNSETCRVCTGGGLLWTASGQPVRDGRNDGVGRGTEYVGPLGEYIAVNLREALKLVPDNGDWHALLRQACDAAIPEGSTQGPNQTAEQMLARMEAP